MNPGPEPQEVVEDMHQDLSQTTDNMLVEEPFPSLSTTGPFFQDSILQLRDLLQSTKPQMAHGQQTRQQPAPPPFAAAVR